MTTIIAEAFPATLLLAAAAILVEYGVALVLGIAAARRRDGAADHVIRVASLVLFSQPPFWLGLMLILLFAHVWPVLPASHMHSIDADLMSPLGRTLDLLRHLILPAAGPRPLQRRAPRSASCAASLIEVMGMDYIRTARAKGLSERRVVWVHGLRNALTPLVQLFAVSFPGLLNGAVLTEIIFSWPGLGRLTFGGDPRPRLPADPGHHPLRRSPGRPRQPAGGPAAGRGRPAGARCVTATSSGAASSPACWR